MASIISIHSFRGGTGKSNIAANVAYVLARRGQRVGIIDTDVQSPGVHAIFGLRGDSFRRSLNDYLLGRSDIMAAVYPLGDNPAPSHEYLRGLPLFLIPSSIHANEIAQVLHEGYDVGLLNDGFYHLMEALNLDALIIDTHPGLNEETLMSIAVSDALCVILRPDEQDFQGTAVTVDIARKLDVPGMVLVANKVPARVVDADLAAQLQREYAVPVAGVLHLSEDMADNGSRHVFAAVQPTHPFSRTIESLADRLTGKT
jgi:MinD-like ATPase involved in chromosome partitioning or flagellar assembly